LSNIIGWEGTLWNLSAYLNQSVLKTLKDHYPSKALFCHEKISSIQFKVKKAKIHKARDLQEAYDTLKDMFHTKKQKFTEHNHIFHFQLENHPGFDGFILLEDQKGNLWAFGHEMKFTENVSMASDAKPKYELWRDQHDTLYKKNRATFNPKFFPKKQNRVFCMISKKISSENPTEEYPWEKNPYTFMFLDIAHLYPTCLRTKCKYLYTH
jgi:hypothetical protein